MAGWFGTIMAFVAGIAAAVTLSADLERGLHDESYIYVSTRRQSGEWSTAKPIWFWYESGKLYFTAGPESWKAKRIRRGSPVRISVGTAEGPTFEGDAAILTDAETVERMGQAYAEKYWIAWLGLFRPRVDRVESGKTVAVVVTPRVNEDPR